MKTLYILRHAKSSWNFNQLSDYDRPLGVRGRKDIRRMAAYLSQHFPTPELMVTSPASRAFYTTLFLADAWDYPEEEILLEESLYHADAETLVQLIKKTKQVQSLVIAGHNPGLTDLINSLSGEHLANLPTCGVVGLNFSVSHWKEIEKETGKQFLLMTPKLVKNT